MYIQASGPELLDTASSSIEVEDVDNDDGMDAVETEGSADVGIRSTKRPTTTKDQRLTKRQKREEALMNKAIACMEKTSDRVQQKRDEDDIFGEYVASEMRAIQNVQMKRWVKFKIQSLFFSAHCEFTSQPPPAFPPSQPFAPPAMQGQWEIPHTSPPAREWSTPCRTPSTTSSINDEYNLM